VVHALHALSQVETRYALAVLDGDEGELASTWERVERGRIAVFGLLCARPPSEPEREALCSHNEWRERACPACAGSGEFPTGECPTCVGIGSITRL